MKTWIRAALGVSFSAVTTLAASSASANPPTPPYITSSWNQSDTSATPLASSNTDYCFLTSATGHYAGGGESVHVWESNGYWYVGGSSQQQGVAASATCLPYSSFTPEHGGFNDWRQLFNQMYANPFPGIATENTWQGDAALMISGITGEYNGGGEFVVAGQAGSATAFDTLTAYAQSENGAGGWGEAFFVGNPGSGFIPSFYGPEDGPTTANEAGEYFASSAAGRGTQTVTMASANEAVCYFSEIGGAFAGGGESVTISRSEDNPPVWKLSVSSQQPNGTFAYARCYALNQSQSQVQ